jgi:hypothetical protein
VAFVGLESGTLHFLAQSSRVATIGVFAFLVLAIGYLGYGAAASAEGDSTPVAADDDCPDGAARW